MTKDYLHAKLKEILAKDKKFKIASELIDKISDGKTWLIGSSVYKNLIKIKHGITLPIDDYDFIVEKLKEPLPRLKGWRISQNTFGNWHFKKGNVIVDPVPLGNMLLLKKWKWKPGIRNYTKAVGFSVQAIALDIKNGKLIGEGAIKDISKRILRINNVITYKWSLLKYGDKVSLKAMAKKLKLKPVK